MSSTQEADIGVSEAQRIMIAAYIVYAAVALYCYDFLVTLGDEIRYIWFPKWSIRSWIFATGRYTTFVYVILQLVPYPNQTTCTWGARMVNICTLLQILAAALLTGLRTYALCSRRVTVFLLVFGLAVVPLIVNMFTYIKSSVVYESAPGGNLCTLAFALSQSQILRVSLISRVTLIAADTIALVVAWRKAFGIAREASRRRIEVSLGQVLVHDGGFFFLAQLLLNVYQFITRAIPSLVGTNIGDPFVSPLSTILMYRFVLNLNKAVSQPGEDRPNFTTVLGSSIYFDSESRSGIILDGLGESSELGDDVSRPLQKAADQHDVEVATSSANY